MGIKHVIKYTQNRHLRKLGNQVVRNLHCIVDVVKYLRQFPFISSQYFWDNSHNVLNLISLEAKLYLADL